MASRALLVAVGRSSPSPLLGLGAIRCRSTKGSYRVKNRTKATKLQHIRNRELRDEREQAHRDRMMMQRKEAVERGVDKDMRKKTFETEREEGLRTSTVIKVANLPFDLEEAALSSLFERYNPIKAVLMRTKTANKSRGFGYVQLRDVGTAEIAAAQKFEVPSATGSARLLKAHVTHKTQWVQ